MKLIMENWRRFLVKETIDPRIRKKINMLLNFREHSGVLGIEVFEMRDSVQFHYVLLNPGREKSFVIPSRGSRGFDGKSVREKLGVPENLPYGQVIIKKPNPNEDGPCSGAYVIKFTEADDGWGPLLYEVAIEWASAIGGGLTPDRFIVSDEAAKVWEKYVEREDVKKSQLDILHDPNVYGYKVQKQLDQLTPNDPTDDCNQYKSVEVGKKNWHKKPHSKLYRKEGNEIIDALSQLGRWKTK